MLSHKDKEILKPAILKVKEALMGEAKFENQTELIDEIVWSKASDKLFELAGMAKNLYLCLQSSFFNTDTQNWLRKVVTL